MCKAAACTAICLGAVGKHGLHSRKTKASWFLSKMHNLEAFLQQALLKKCIMQKLQDATALKVPGLSLSQEY